MTFINYEVYEFKINFMYFGLCLKWSINGGGGEEEYFFLKISRIHSGIEVLMGFCL